MTVPTRYCLGFVFSPDRGRVLLIRKRRPAWQAGRLNGIGGHCLDTESMDQTMRREAGEEAGIGWLHWAQNGFLNGERFTIGIFYAVLHGHFPTVSPTDEELVVVNTAKIDAADTVAHVAAIVDHIVDASRRGVLPAWRVWRA